MPLSYTRKHEEFMQDLRLLMEEICSNICRFEHVLKEGIDPREVKIHQESYLGFLNSFSDIRVKVADRPAYFVEVKLGYHSENILNAMKRKFGAHAIDESMGNRLVIVVDLKDRLDWKDVELEIRKLIHSSWQLEIWDEKKLFELIEEWFSFKMVSFDERYSLELKNAFDDKRGRLAFGDQWQRNTLQMALLWHFGFWRLKELRERYGLTERSDLPPKMYEDVVALRADLSSFSSYVRDTPSTEIVRQALTSFYAKARHEILNTGGMLNQFIGDEVIGFFGLPDKREDYVESALECALALMEVATSVSNQWQRMIDRVQGSRGAHIGIAMGDVQIVSLQPFGRAHIGAVGDTINMAARLVIHAGPGDIVASNTYYRSLMSEYRQEFVEMPPLEAKNLGHIKGWKLPMQIPK